MRKVRRRLWAWLMIFVSGGMMGYLMGWVTEIAEKRQGYCGGEALILPAYVLIFVVGWRGSKAHYQTLYKLSMQKQKSHRSKTTVHKI